MDTRSCATRRTDPIRNLTPPRLSPTTDMSLSKIIPSLLAGGALVAAAHAKMPVMAAYWAADRRASETVKDHYPAGVLPGTINRLILTHVKFQNFEKLESTDMWKKNLAEYKLLKEKGVSIWVMIANSERDFLDQKASSNYIKELVDFCVRNDIDGVDIDFEGDPVGHPNFNAFCRELADALHAKKKQVSMAVHPHWTFPKVEDATLAKLDYVMAMAYDERGSWDKNKHGPHSTFEYAESCVDKVRKRNVPPEKILLGMPTYGYRWWTENGEKQAAEIGWPAVVKKFPGQNSKDVAGAGYRTPEGIWHYNGIPTVRKKVAWANRQKLAGIGVWHGNYEVKSPMDSFWLNVRAENR